MDSWALYVDIEGFSYIYKNDRTRALILLRHLAGDLYKIGTRAYTGKKSHSDERDRLFIYQFGDGFVVSPHLESNFTRPVALAISLMRSMLCLQNGVLRTAISRGGMYDFLGCYPKSILENLDKKNSRIIPLGDGGLMTINPVIGDGLISAYNLLKREPKGPLLIIEDDFNAQIQKSGFSTYTCGYHSCINWIHSENDLVFTILEKMGVKPLSKNVLCNRINDYLAHNKNLSDEWIKSAKTLIHESTCPKLSP